MTEQVTHQRYFDDRAHERMSKGTCPECGDAPDAHSSDTRFWIPRTCDLTQQGASDRIQQYERDLSARWCKSCGRAREGQRVVDLQVGGFMCHTPCWIDALDQAATEDEQ